MVGETHRAIWDFGLSLVSCIYVTRVGLYFLIGYNIVGIVVALAEGARNHTKAMKKWGKCVREWTWD